ncbi:hypothetical protein GCM10015536_76020 [Streptomyces griseomycini]|nr:hypothetical protein GCM10015536_76020 [Streptomyces griseomycini]
MTNVNDGAGLSPSTNIQTRRFFSQAWECRGGDGIRSRFFRRLAEWRIPSHGPLPAPGTTAAGPDGRTSLRGAGGGPEGGPLSA